MITDHTTPVEAFFEIRNEQGKVSYRENRFHERTAKQIQKKGPPYNGPRYVLERYTIPDTKNTYTIVLKVTETRSNGGFFITPGWFLPVEAKDGRQYLMISEDEGEGFLYRITQHFISRYKERRHLPDDTPAAGVIVEFWSSIDGAFKTFDNNSEINLKAARYARQEGIFNQYAEVKGGIVFADKSVYANTENVTPRRITVVDLQTFIPEENLKESQKRRIEKDRTDDFIQTLDSIATGAVNSGDRDSRTAAIKLMGASRSGRLRHLLRKGMHNPMDAMSAGLAEPIRTIINTNTDMQKKRLSEIQKKEVVVLYASGMTIGEIARKYGSDENIIRKLVDRGGKITEKEPAPAIRDATSFTQDEIDGILRNKNMHRTYTQIAAKFGTTEDVIKEIVTRNKERFNELFAKPSPETAPQQPETKQSEKTQPVAEHQPAPTPAQQEPEQEQRRREEITQMYREGATYKELQAMFSCGPVYLSSFLKGVKRNTKPAVAETPEVTAPQPEKTQPMENEPETKKEPIKTTTLADFAAKDIIAHLEDLGYAVTKNKPEPEKKERTFTERDLLTILRTYADGTPMETIRQRYGISTEVLQMLLPPKEEEKPAPVPCKTTLEDFEAEEIIRHMYGLGYRIENGILIQIKKVKIDLAGIIPGKD